MNNRPDWRGVYPAATTQFAPDLSVDLDATRRVQGALLDDGVHGLVVMGTVGENNSLTAAEKREVLRGRSRSLGGRVPVIAGVSELTTQAAAVFARDAEAMGADGLMVLPAMVYVPSEQSWPPTSAPWPAPPASDPALQQPAGLSREPDPPALEALTGEANIEAIKESSTGHAALHRHVNALGDRYALMAGLDDVALEGLVLGARGWVSGLTNAFPEESLALYEAAVAGDLERAPRDLSLVHAAPAPRRRARPRPGDQALRAGDGAGFRAGAAAAPPLEGDRRAEVIGLMERAKASRPKA